MKHDEMTPEMMVKYLEQYAQSKWKLSGETTHELAVSPEEMRIIMRMIDGSPRYYSRDDNHAVTWQTSFGSIKILPILDRFNSLLHNDPQPIPGLANLLDDIV